MHCINMIMSFQVRMWHIITIYNVLSGICLEITESFGSLQVVNDTENKVMMMNATENILHYSAYGCD